MELRTKETDTYYDVFDGDQAIITVHRCDVPDDFNPERTARMIMNMEEMLYMLKHKFGHIKSRERDKLLDFIEHGDKEKKDLKKLLKTLIQYHKEGRLMSAIDSCMKEIEEFCNE